MLLPLVWSVPIALACSELASAFPLEGGYYQWGRMAFGDVAGYLIGWWTWLGIFATNATFAVMFTDYLGYWIEMNWWWHWGVSLMMIWLVTFMNFRGIRFVGSSSVWMSVVLLLPFVVLIGMGILQWHQNPFMPFHHPDKTPLKAFGESLMVGVWLYSGYDKITVSAEEVENPKRNFPLAFGIAVPMVALSYILPTLTSLAAKGNWTLWQDKYFSVVA